MRLPRIRFTLKRIAIIVLYAAILSFGVRLMSELYDSFHPMTCKRALQTAKKLADDLRAKGFGVANGTCDGSQLYKSVRLEEAARK